MSQSSRKSSYKFAETSDSFIRILFAAFQHIYTDFVDVRANRCGTIGLQLALTQESFNWHSLSTASSTDSPTASPPSTRSQQKTQAIQGLSPTPTRSRQKTQAIRHDIHRLRVSFGKGRAEGLRPTREHKNAVGRRIRTGPQPFGQNTSLDPNSAQLKQPTEPQMRSAQRAALPSV